MEMDMEKDGLELGEVKKHFFKILVGDFETCLRIPPQFVKNLLDEKEGAINRSKSVRATIEGPSGRIWNLKIEKKRDGLFFTTGWPKFVEDHVLHKCELLVFGYNGNFHFSVMIFAVSGCEKEEKVRETRTRGVRENETLVTPQDGRSNNGSSSSKQKEEVEEITIMPSHMTNYDGLVSCDGDLKSVKAVMSFRSKFPSSVIHISSYMAKGSGPLRFSNKFSRMYLPSEKTTFTLRDPRGEEWCVEYVPNVGSLVSGWTAFKKANLLREDDCCVFELVKPTQFRVHIFRASG